MIPRHRVVLALVLWTSALLPAVGCELVLTEHRSGRPLLQLPLDPAHPLTRLAFVHSVLQTPVLDVYRWRAQASGPWQAYLEQEHFEGEGYGLPHTAAGGETLVREGRGWRLDLSRKVDPLVVRPLPAQRMRLVRPGHADLLLATLSTQAIEFQTRDCRQP